MKGNECFQEDALCVEHIAPGKKLKSEMFIRDSAVFDRIEWVGDLSIEADQAVPKSWITFNKAIPPSFNPGCLLYSLLIIIAAALFYLFRYLSN